VKKWSIVWLPKYLDTFQVIDWKLGTIINFKNCEESRETIAITKLS